MKTHQLFIILLISCAIYSGWSYAQNITQSQLDQDRIDSDNNQIHTLQGRIIDSQKDIDYFTNQISNLQSDIDSINQVLPVAQQVDAAVMANSVIQPVPVTP